MMDSVLLRLERANVRSAENADHANCVIVRWKNVCIHCVPTCPRDVVQGSYGFLEKAVWFTARRRIMSIVTEHEYSVNSTTSATQSNG